MAEQAVKAVIFDCFGVLVRAALYVFFDKHFAHDEMLQQKADEIDHMGAAGYMSFDEQVTAFAELAGIREEQVRVELADTPANTPLLEYIRDELKPHYKIGFLSNAAADFTDELFTPEQKALFDDIVLSYTCGFAKPDERIYELSAHNLEVTPEESVFVDDTPRYCVGAEAAGMRAVQYNDFRQFIRDIEKLL